MLHYLERKLSELNEQIEQQQTKKKVIIKRADTWIRELQRRKDKLWPDVVAARKEAASRTKEILDSKITEELKIKTGAAVSRELEVSRERVYRLKRREREREDTRDWRMLTDIRFIHKVAVQRGKGFVEHVADVRTRKIQLPPEETKEQERWRYERRVRIALRPMVKVSAAEFMQGYELLCLVRLLRGISVEGVPEGIELRSVVTYQKVPTGAGR